MATAVNVGGQYAEEACLSAGVEKNRKAKELSEDDVHKLYEALSIMLTEATSNLRPREVLEDGKAVDVTPIPLIQYATKEAREHLTFSDALHNYVSNLAGPE